MFGMRNSSWTVMAGIMSMLAGIYLLLLFRSMMQDAAPACSGEWAPDLHDSVLCFWGPDDKPYVRGRPLTCSINTHSRADGALDACKADHPPYPQSNVGLNEFMAFIFGVMLTFGPGFIKLLEWWTEGLPVFDQPRRRAAL